MEELLVLLRDLLPGVPDPRLEAVVRVVASGLGRLGGRPRNGLTHVESDVSKPVPKHQIRPISLSESESGSVLIPDPDLSQQSGLAEGEPDEPEPAGFLEFWGLYPKKVGKADARRVWRRRRPPIGKVRAALAWQVRSHQWRMGYVPNPSTYINQGRWEDEPPSPGGGGPNGLSEREARGAVAGDLFVRMGKK